MTRGLSPAELAAAQTRNTEVVQLVTVAFVGGDLNLCTGGNNVAYGGTTWSAARGLLINPVDESAESTEGIRFEISGVEPDIITIAAQEPYIRRPVYLYEMWLDEATHAPVAPPRLEWVGKLTALDISEDGGSVLVSGSAEHFDAEDSRARTLHYNNATQAIIDPADTAFSRVEEMTELVLVWPAKEALYKK